MQSVGVQAADSRHLHLLSGYVARAQNGLSHGCPTKHSTALCRGGGPVLAQFMRPLFRYPLPFACNVMVEDPLFIPCHQSVQKWLTSVTGEQGTADVHSLLLL